MQWIEKTRRGLGAVTVLIVYSFMLSSFCNGQAISRDFKDKKALTELTYSGSPSPVKFNKIKIGGKLLTSSAVTAVNGKWWDDLLFEVRNTSGKQIKSLLVEFRIPIKNSEITEVIIPIMPDKQVEAKEKIVILPNELVKFSFGKNDYERIMGSIVRQGYEIDDSTVRYNIGLVEYSDNTSWKQGYLHKQDKNNPKRWSVTEDSPKKSVANSFVGRLTDGGRCYTYTGYNQTLDCDPVPPSSSTECIDGGIDCETERYEVTCCSEGGVSSRSVLRFCVCLYSRYECGQKIISEFDGACPR